MGGGGHRWAWGCWAWGGDGCAARRVPQVSCAVHWSRLHQEESLSQAAIKSKLAWALMKHNTTE